MIRAATLSDLDWINDLGRQFHSMCPHARFADYDPISFLNTCKFLIEDENSILFIGDGGLIGGILCPLYYNTRYKVAEESFWFSCNSGAGLLAVFEQWARNRGATFLLMSGLHNERSKAFGRLMRTRDYRQIEHRFMKAL